MKQKTISKRMLALLLCILTLCSLLPAATAFATNQVTIDSSNATDYFIYLSGSGTWEDLSTPQHFVVESGDVAYCIQHKMGNPHSREYSAYNPIDDYSTRTIRGLQIILENGYPCSTGGFSDAQARYATANAVRFWLSEEGADGQWNFTNRPARPNAIKAKSGYESLLAWADQLVALARNQTLMTHSVSFSPNTLEMTASGNYFIGTTRVSLVNCSGGYRLNQSALPTGTVVTGFTGNNGDTLTIKIPAANGNQTLRLSAVGYDNRTTANLFWYAPDASSYQKVITYAAGNYAPATDAVLRMTTPAYGKIEIVKTDAENGAKLAGAVFGIYSNAACTQEIARLKVGADSTATSGDLIMSRYYIKEISAVQGYVVNPNVYPADVTTTTYTITVPNTPVKGRIQITKTNADPAMGDYPLTGSVFDIYKGEAVVASVTVDASGKGTSAAISLGNYVVKERKSSSGFVINRNEYPVTLSYAGQTVPVVYGDVTVPNSPQTGTISVTKADAETGDPQGDATLYGAKYEIRDMNGKVVDTLHALGTRVVTSKPLPLQTFRVYEVATPTGYLLNENPIEVTLSYGGQNVEIVSAKATVKDDVIKGKISVVKFGSSDIDDPSNPDPDIKPPLENVQFEIRLKSSGVLVDTLVTDADGKATSKALPYGTYLVTELRSDANEGYKLVNTFEVFIGENDKTYSYILEDKIISMMIKLVKVDADTGKTIPVAGTVFRVENAAGKPVTFELLYPQPHTLSEFTTDESGTLFLPGTLPVGNFRLFEVSAPSSYLLNNEPVAFTVSEGSATNQVITVKLKDTAAKGKISIEKRGEMLTGHTTEETKYGTKYIPVYKMKGLEGVVYQIVAAENIGTPDGTVYHRAGEVVCEITTGHDGRAETDALYLGKYLAVEKSTVSGMVLDTTQHEVTLSYADQHTAIVTESLALENQRQKATAEVLKTAEYFDEASGAFYDNYGEGFVFGLYTKTAVGDIPADALMDILVTAKDGKAVSTADIPLAEYCLKELDIPAAYKDNNAAYALDLTSKNDADAVFTDSAEAYNELKKGKVIVYKTDEYDDERGLEGVVFEVRKKGGSDVICLITTLEGGRGESQLLPYGDYVLKERETKSGFCLSDKEYEVTIGEKTPAVKLSLTNKPTEVILEKTDITTSDAVPGATIEVRNETGEVVFTDVTNLDGVVVIHELHAGQTYTWREAIAPEGYAINLVEFTFHIDEYGSITGDTEMTDEPITVVIQKKNEYNDKPIGGVEFALFDADGNAVKLNKSENGAYMPDENGSNTIIVDENGKAIVKYLKAGEYKLYESAPEGFIAAEHYTLSVTDEYGESNPYTTVIYNQPTAFRLYKVHADTGKPLSGAGFTFKTKGALFFSTLKFNKLGDGLYEMSVTGKEDKLMVSAAGELNVIGLPLGEVWCEESVVPKGFFPIAAFKIEITNEHCAEAPLTVTVKNNVFVKLGLDSDKYDWLWMTLGCIGIAGLGACLCVCLVKRKKRNLPKNESEEN